MSTTEARDVEYPEKTDPPDTDARPAYELDGNRGVVEGELEVVAAAVFLAGERVEGRSFA